MEKRHYTLEYVDNDGDSVIEHLIIDQKEIDCLIKNMLGKGIMFTLIENSSVTSEDEKKILE